MEWKNESRCFWEKRMYKTKQENFDKEYSSQGLNLKNIKMYDETAVIKILWHQC